MIVTPLDSAQLDSKEQYVFYHKMVDFALKELIIGVQHQQICSKQELALFNQYCNLLTYTIESMRIKYMYDEEDNMKIDLTDSGFPNYLEFRYLFNDLELRDQHIQRLPSLKSLQDDFLDTLMRRKQHISKRKLFEASSIAYYTSVKKEYIFNRFVQGKILGVPKNLNYDTMTSWSFYDVSLNRPFICFMYFNHDKDKILDFKDEIYDTLKQTADRKMPMDAMAYAIDRRLGKLKPKIIKRIDLGPLHNIFAKDEHEITHAILDSIGKKEIPTESFAMSFKIDEIRSGGEIKKGSFFSKQIFQKWDNPTSEKYVFAPHRIIQMLYNKTPEVMNKLAKAPIQVSDLKIEK